MQLKMQQLKDISNHLYHTGMSDDEQRNALLFLLTERLDEANELLSAIDIKLDLLGGTLEGLRVRM